MRSLNFPSLLLQIKKRFENKKFPLSIIILDDYKVQSTLLLNCNIEEKFQAASISKTITSLVTLKLHQESILNIDKDVNKYLKLYKITNENGKVVRVTLRQLLNHTAGCTVSGFAGYSIREIFPSLNQICN